MKKFIVSLALVALSFSIAPASAQARSFVSVLATVPGAIFHVVTVGTDTAEYVTGKVAYGFSEIDMYADAAAAYFAAESNPQASATAVAKNQARAAKKAAKKAAKAAAKYQPNRTH